MITIVRADKRYKAENGWLVSYHLFSFADYYDPQNMQFGNLRVFNDDEIASDTGFGEHSHDNMEIVTIVLEGELTHKDSLGNTGVIRAGEVQHMSAGSGVRHAEMNDSLQPVHLYQIWIAPTEENIPPAYEQKDFSEVSNTNILLPVASGEQKEGALPMRAAATIYTSLLLEGKTIMHTLSANRGVFIYSKWGFFTVNGVEVMANDQARISEESEITVTAQEDSEFILIEVDL